MFENSLMLSQACMFERYNETVKLLIKIFKFLSKRSIEFYYSYIKEFDTKCKKHIFNYGPTRLKSR